MLIEEYEEESEEQPCPICGDDDNEDLLLACDGCDTYSHTYCVGLDRVPVGHWYCETCNAQRAIESVCPSAPSHQAQPQHHTADRRTRGQLRQVRYRNQANSSSWARVWQSVWDNLNLDLDFPFDDASDAARIDRAQRTVASQRREFRQWERRFQVAERQGGSNRFRDTASTLLDLHATREHPTISESESRDEIRAWNALEKAKEIELDPSLRRKRSATTSPSDAEPITQPQRPFKRPRTRRTLDPAESSSHNTAEASRSRRGSAARPSSSRASSLHNGATHGNGPSFLQCMLKEIESSSAPHESQGQSRLALHPTTRHSSPHPSSPGASPTTSNHASPRARSITPPPSISTRPGSPFSLTSKVEPIFPPPEFSPVRSPPDTLFALRPHNEAKPSAKVETESRPHRQGSSPTRSHDTSPIRAMMPLSTKSDLQRMVSNALKPHYQSNTVSKDQYTDINRNVSRMLYELVGGTGSVDGGARKTWERLASDEVAKAVQSLKATT